MRQKHGVKILLRSISSQRRRQVLANFNRDYHNMIGIINVGKGDSDIGGWRTYEVRINRDLICEFQHKRSDGLAVCLKKASLAVAKAERKKNA